MDPIEPRPPLTSTFRLARGIGPVTEERLWRRGVRTWDDVADGRPGGVRGAALREAIAQVRADLASGRGDFLRDLDPSLLWRAYPTFRGRCALPVEPLMESPRRDNPIEYQSEAIPRLLPHVAAAQRPSIPSSPAC